MANPATNMTEQDRRVMFTALSFLAVAVREGGDESNDNAARALVLAAQVEKFCRLAYPDVFAE
ncbi:MAG: hypothetical protein P4M15_03570 [Alphaproteobacteria bacterium]|nr:hypothetical protein [Alphaproteobacteria bacterium]